MRIVETKVFQFAELSDHAKQHAIEDFRTDYMPFPWMDEYWDSAQAFCKEIGIKLHSWDEQRGIEYTISLDDDIKQLSGLRAWKWLNNNIFQHYKGRYISYLEAALLNRDGAYTLTGYCADCNLFDPIAEIVNNPGGIDDLETLFSDCLYSWSFALRDDIEYSYSDEAITEMIEANGYEFTEDGTIV